MSGSYLTQNALGPGMGVAVDVHQVRRIHRGIDLRRRQAGMAEQLLEGAEIGAAPEQMGREAVPQCMGRRPLGQSQPHTRPADRAAAVARCRARGRASSSRLTALP